MNEPTVNAAGEMAIPRQAQDHAIEALAKEMHVDIDFVRTLYQSERARLESQARIKTYVSVLATRLVREALTRNTHVAIQ